MKYLKKNKVFVFLVSSLSICILLLSYKIINPNTTTNTNESINVDTNANTSIEDFTVNLTERLTLTFNWNITLGNDAIEKMEIYHDNKLLVDVSDRAAYSLDFLNSNIPTGNNEFTFKVTLDNNQEIVNNHYIYLNEVFDFQVHNERKDTKMMYTATYYYDKTKPVNAPKVVISRLNQNVSLPFTFVKNEKVSEDARFIKMSSVYELDLTNAIPGSYSMDFTWTFNEHNLNFQSSSNFDVLE